MFQIIWWFHLFLLSCDGDSCFDDYNCLGNTKDSTVNSQTSNIPTGQSAQGRGGIVQISPDGQLVKGKGILGEKHPLNMYYSYGIRDDIGFDFDPISGRLWDTENGPGFGGMKLTL